MALKMKILVLCKFTPLEFETLLCRIVQNHNFRVNLLRWSLKHRDRRRYDLQPWCKFTPLEFETMDKRIFRNFLILV